MDIKKLRFDSWEELKTAALRYERMGYACECRGWDDISNLILTIKTDPEEDKEWKRQD